MIQKKMQKKIYLNIYLKNSYYKQIWDKGMEAMNASVPLLMYMKIYKLRYI